MSLLSPSSQAKQPAGTVPEGSLGSSERAIRVSPKAAAAIKQHLAKRGTPDAMLRVGIRGGGCSGFSYVIEYYDGPLRLRDRLFECEGVRVVSDPKSLVYLDGAVLEWEQTLMRQGFYFANPNEKTSCGCGHSFTVETRKVEV